MEQLKNVVDFKLPKKKKIKEQLEPMKDNRKFVVFPLWVFQELELTAKQLKVLGLLCSYCNRAGITWVSHAKIGQDCNPPVSKQSIQLFMKRFKKLGIIEVIGKHKQYNKGETIRVIFDKELSLDDVISATNDGQEENKFPEMIKKEREEVLSGPKVEDIPIDDSHQPMETFTKEELETNRRRINLLKKAVRTDSTIRKGGLNKIEVDQHYMGLLKEDIELSKKKKETPTRSDNKKTKKATRSKSSPTRLEGVTDKVQRACLNTSNILTIDILIDIYNKYINGYLMVGQVPKITEEDMKASEMLINAGMTEEQFRKTIETIKEYKPLADILLEVTNKYSF